MKLTTMAGYVLGITAVVALAVTAPIKAVALALRGKLVRRPQLG